MIKPGSGTELVVPAEEGLEIRVHLGDNVIAGTSVLAAYVDIKVESARYGEIKKRET